jgi:N-acyl-phosphatidylethanolamine-hydrolysing phospholipase D
MPPDGARGDKAILHSPARQDDHVRRSSPEESWRLLSATQYVSVVNEAPPLHHRPGGGYRNPWPESEPQGFGGIVRWIAYDRIVHPRAKDPPSSAFPIARPSFARPRTNAQSITATWVGHSTMLMQVAGANVLTDPVWSDRASPVRFAGPRRHVPPAFALDALPPIDIVLISHNHYDHLDDDTVRALVARQPGAAWAVPLGVAEFVRMRGARRVVELDWWQRASIGTIELTCTPAQHFSGRGIGDRNRTLWASWSVRAGSRAVYFGGDSAYHPVFASIGTRCGPFDAVFLPIGAYEPRWFMRTVHMNPEEAVRAYLDLTTAQRDGLRAAMVPIHWGTFKLTDEPLDEPPARVRAAWTKAGLPEAGLWLLRHGETRAVTFGP